jgi:tetratricopeptide (TPR) repeat protein
VVTRATFALFEGRFEEAKELIAQAVTLGVRAQASDAVLSYRVQLFTLHLHSGSLGEVEDVLRSSITEYPARPMFRCMLAYLLTESAREAEAGVLFDELADDRFAALPMTNEWLFSLSFLGDVAHRLHDRERANILYELLLPFAARNACTADYIATGSVSRPLGVAATTMTRWDDAERHFEDALRMNTKMGARPWSAWTTCDWAEMLLHRDGPGDGERAVELLARAVETAHQLGMTALLKRAAALGKRGGDTVREARVSAATPAVFRRDGEFWSVAYERDTFRLKDSKGLRYLARVLGEPGREFHALDLVAGERGVVSVAGSAEPGLASLSLGDAGATLDTQAKAEYRRRLDELEGELDEARASATRSGPRAQKRNGISSCASWPAQSVSAAEIAGWDPRPSARASASRGRSAPRSLASASTVRRSATTSNGRSARGRSAPTHRTRAHRSTGEYGFRVVDVWESEDAVRRFGDVLIPILRELGVEGEPEIYPTHSFVSA